MSETKLLRPDEVAEMRAASSSNLGMILHDRNRTYGDYRDNAKIMQEIKDLFRAQPGWARLNAMHREALDCFALKIGRILVGDPDHRDSWDDIAGYARCVSDRIPVAGVPVLERQDGLIVRTSSEESVSERLMRGQSIPSPEEQMDEARTRVVRDSRLVPGRRMEDGVAPADAEDAWWPKISVRAPCGTFLNVDRRAAQFSPDDLDHLPRLQLEMNDFEHRGEREWYKPMYVWDPHQSKWLLKEEYRDHWGQMP